METDRSEQVEKDVMVMLQAARLGRRIDGLLSASDTGGAVRPARVELIELDEIRLHESCDAGRVHLLARAIDTDGLQRHPIIVGRVENRPLVHLDGATRIAALRQLRCQHVAAQVVDYCNYEAVSLETWSHITTLSPSTLLRAARSWSGCVVEPTDCSAAHAGLMQGELMTALVFADGNVLGLRCHAPVVEKIEILNQLTALYGAFTVREVPPEVDRFSHVQRALRRHAPANVSIAFSTFSKDEVLEVALGGGKLFPPGITRHIINCGRVLHVNTPLALLQSQDPAPEKMQKLQATLATRHERVYREPTVQYEG
jgi:hypothetical protein